MKAIRALAFVIFLGWAPLLQAQVVAEPAGDFVEEPKQQPAGETIFAAFPIDKWEQPSVSVDIAIPDLEADPDIVMETIFEISKDGVNFEMIASIITKGGPQNFGDKTPGPPGFRLSRKDVIPDGWVGRMKVVTNKVLTFGAKAEPAQK